MCGTFRHRGKAKRADRFSFMVGRTFVATTITNQGFKMYNMQPEWVMSSTFYILDVVTDVSRSSL